MTRVKISRQNPLLNLIAYEKGVYVFKFTGDKTYLDSQGVTWTWQGVEDIAPTILGIRSGVVDLVPAQSLAEVIATDGSWYYPSPILYIHWHSSAGDWSVDRSVVGTSVGDTLNFSDHFNPIDLNYDNGLFFIPALEKVSQFGYSIDPTKLGLSIASEIRAKIIDNSQTTRSQITLPISIGSIMAVDVDGERVLTGITKSVEADESSIDVIATERRFFSDPKICQFVLTSALYPDISDDIAGSVAPIVFGKVRKSRVIPVNTKNVIKANSATIRFLISQPGINLLSEQGLLYDSNGFEVKITNFNLSDCWVEYLKPANAEVDLKNFSWSGTAGTTNGLQIIQDAFDQFANVPYITSLWDTSVWDTAKSNFDSISIGLTVNDTQNLLSGIVDPICNSLQIAMYTTGSGQISVNYRNTLPPTTVLEYAQMENISYQIDSRSFGPEIRVEYSPGVDGYLTAIADQHKTAISEIYGIVLQSQINPAQTVLSDQADAIDLATVLADINKEPIKIRGFTTPINPTIIKVRPFDNIEADGELLEVNTIESDIYTQRVRITGRIKKWLI